MTALMPEMGPLAELPAMPATAAPILLPGLLRGLGLTAAPETDYEASLRLELTEDYAAYDTRMHAAAEAVS